ncbi:MAG: hypothetical protein M3Q71_23005 [Chloroflexota bacterium]|nr:hypothetical protein [Chloroflexota bacterium]MDP9473495.1 hypothetical protein [Chloroflexota bacterium]
MIQVKQTSNPHEEEAKRRGLDQVVKGAVVEQTIRDGDCGFGHVQRCSRGGLEHRRAG